MKLVTKAKTCGFILASLLGCTCLFLPLNGGRHEFLGYHAVWNRPDTGTIDFSALQVEWLLIFAGCSILFFLLDPICGLFGFLKQRGVLRATAIAVVGIPISIWIVNLILDSDRLAQQQAYFSEAEDNRKISEIIENRRRLVESQKLKQIADMAVRLRKTLYSPKTWTPLKLSPLAATATLQTRMMNETTLAYKFWFSGKAEDIEEAVVHYDSTSILLIDSSSTITVSIPVNRNDFVWKGQPGKKTMEISGTYPCLEETYSCISTWSIH